MRRRSVTLRRNHWTRNLHWDRLCARYRSRCVQRERVVIRCLPLEHFKDVRKILVRLDRGLCLQFGLLVLLSKRILRDAQVLRELVERHAEALCQFIQRFAGYRADLAKIRQQRRCIRGALHGLGLRIGRINLRLQSGLLAGVIRLQVIALIFRRLRLLGLQVSKSRLQILDVRAIQGLRKLKRLRLECF